MPSSVCERFQAMSGHSGIDYQTLLDGLAAGEGPTTRARQPFADLWKEIRMRLQSYGTAQDCPLGGWEARKVKAHQRQADIKQKSLTETRTPS